MTSIITLKVLPDTPPHLCSPPFDIKRPQTEHDANNPPLASLPKSLIPGTFGKAIRPPRMEFGCWIEDDHMREIAGRLGCLEEARGFPVDWRVKFALRDKLGLCMDFTVIYTGITDPKVGSAYDQIYTFGSNYDLHKPTFPKGESLIKLLKILCIRRSTLQWWVSEDDWKWKFVDLERERWLKECNVREWNEWADMVFEIYQENLRKEAEKTNKEAEKTNKEAEKTNEEVAVAPEI